MISLLNPTSRTKEQPSKAQSWKLPIIAAVLGLLLLLQVGLVLWIFVKQW